MPYKALFLDIDDTLITNSGSVSVANRSAIKRAEEAGVFVTVATGRGYLGSSSIWKSLGFQKEIIVYGGARIMDTRTDREVYCAEIDPQLIIEALSAANEWGVHSQIYLEDAVVCERETEFARRYTSLQVLPLRVDPDIRKKEWARIPKILVYAPPEREAEMVRRFIGRFSGRLEVACSKPGFIELNQFGVHKGAAMLRLAGMLNIRQEETIAIGDNTLDLEMIKMAGLGLCVENGQSIVKAAADAVIPSCEENGVQYAIEKYILS